MAFFEVKHLSKLFGSTEALHDISFQMKQGECLCIIGSSGSGKTTLLRCLNGLEEIKEGEILLEGKPIEQKEIQRHFGYVFQQFYLFPQYTALENITLALKLHKVYPFETIQAIAKDLLSKMGLENRAHYYPHELSGGQQQRVAIARAMTLRPSILCFDEPTSALDPELTIEVLNVIKELISQKMTMIIVTHDITFARQVANHIIFIDDGHIVEEGDETMIDSPKLDRTKRFLASVN